MGAGLGGDWVRFFIFVVVGAGRGIWEGIRATAERMKSKTPDNYRKVAAERKRGIQTERIYLI